MNKSFDSSVYVDTIALADWSKEMSKINTDASDTLDTFLSQVEQLDSSWAGNSATAFLNSSSDFISASKSCHNQMADVEMFLYQVIETMENE